MKITDEQIEKDLEICNTAKAFNGAWWGFNTIARTRWPLYINELKELRKEFKNLKTATDCERDCVLQMRAELELENERLKAELIRTRSAFLPE